tara:strand:+ start:2022 stop:2732 length:711 start_codon:yes stop_codon:yes gene_type:complete
MFNNKKELKFYNKKKVFIPTQTTRYLYKATEKYISKRKNLSLADMGTGNGIIGISLYKNLRNIKKLHFSDISKEAISICKKNTITNKIKDSNITFLVSNVFSNFQKEKFDVIINDISGISEKVAKISPWFRDVPCSSGENGTDLTLQFLNNYKNFLNKKGMIFFPIISLCNEKQIINFLEKKKINYKIISTNIWPLPRSMYRYKKELNILKKKKIISFDEKFNLIIATTKILIIRN